MRVGGRVAVSFGVEFFGFGDDFLLHFFGHLFVVAEFLGVNAAAAGEGAQDR